MNDQPPSVDSWLREQAEEIRQLTRQTAAAVVRIGLILIEAKKRLGRERFWPWVETELHWSSSTAVRMLRVGQVFGNVPTATVERLLPSALYVLSQRSTPAEVREKVIASASAEKPVGELEVKRLVAEARGKLPPPSPPVRAKGKRPGRPTRVTAEAAALVSLLSAGAEVTFLRRAADAGHQWVCRVTHPSRPPAEHVSPTCPTAALRLAQEAAPTQPAGFGRDKAGREERRRAAEAYIRAHPTERRTVIARNLGVTERYVLGVQRRMGGSFARKREEVVRERVREMLLADPTVTDAAVVEAVDTSPKNVRVIRAMMEVLGHIPVATTRTDRKGVPLMGKRLADADVRPVDDLTGELSAA